MQLAESDLLFEFPDDWVVRKYDDTAAYQSLSGHGLKGVDFIALVPDGTLWLIEVKNYRPRSRADREYRARRPDPQRLAEKVLGKFRDTDRLLRIVDTALRRRWWTRLRLRWQAWHGRPRPASNYWFWTEARRRLDDPARLVWVLWMETPETAGHYDERLHALMRPEVAAATKLLVAERDRHRNLPFKVYHGLRTR